MKIIIVQTSVSLMNPPNEGTVMDDGKEWKIGRNGDGMIVLRRQTVPNEVHPEFVSGMDLLSFCHWVNDKL